MAASAWFSLGVTGAGAAATNVILTKANAHIDGSDVTADDVTLTATDTSEIEATILATAIALAGGTVAAGISIGVAFAQNLIGWTLDGVASPAEVRAYLFETSVAASGALTLSATSNQTVDATVLSGSVAVAGGLLGVGLGGAGSAR